MTLTVSRSRQQKAEAAGHTAEAVGEQRVTDTMLSPASYSFSPGPQLTVALGTVALPTSVNIINIAPPRQTWEFDVRC